ncbi:MAG: dTDP-4-dehydrorhamnose reductase [Pedobacter sp.]
MKHTPRILALVGARGMLAQTIQKGAPDGYEIRCLARPQFDVTDAGVVASVLGDMRPHVIVNCAAYTLVDGCESEADTAFRVNGEGPGNLATVARDLGATLVHISTDYVFPGDAHTASRETDVTGPRSVYGRSKLAGEEAIAASGLDNYFIIRTSWLYGPGGKNFVETMVRFGKEREELRVVADQVGSPTFTDDLARAIFNLLDLESNDGEPPYGLYHFSNEGTCSWHEFAEAILAEARAAGEPIMAKRVVPIGTADYPLPATRPAYSVLCKDKYRRATGADVPHWQDSLALYFKNERN